MVLFSKHLIDVIVSCISFMVNLMAGLIAYTFSSKEAEHKGYYNRYRPHQHNDGSSPIEKEKQYWKTYKEVAKKG